MDQGQTGSGGSDDLLAQDATALSGLIAQGALSAEELMRATLARIDAVNPAVNAIVSLRDSQTLLAAARAADSSPRRGWLHGIPIAIKDLADAAGLPTSRGSPQFANAVADHDDIFVARLRAAGAIIIGKTNTPEFGLGSHTFNPVFGATHNPFDTTRSAGGSSGGAAVALATGMLAVADGSDMMGSLRNPAGWNNVYGMRPTWGLVPSEPEGDSFLHQLSTSGPMARSPRDVAALLATMSGPDARLPHGLAPFDPAVTTAMPRRIGWLGDWGGAFAMEEGILDHATRALSRFADLGCMIEEVAAPFSAAALWDSWTTLRSWAVAANLAPLQDEARAALKPEACWEIEHGLALSPLDIHRASVIRSDWFRAAVQMFGRYDALVLPSAQVWPFPVGDRWPASIAGRSMDTYHRWMEVVVPVSLIGLPCIAIPGGFGPGGLPFGVQVFGRRGADGALLTLAARWDALRSLPGQQPAGRA